MGRYLGKKSEALWGLEGFSRRGGQDGWMHGSDEVLCPTVDGECVGL